MNNTFRYLGHAGFWIRTAKFDIIMDPWFSKKGAYHSGWFQWPANQKYFETFYTEVCNSNRKCYIYLSHEHEDHFCVDTLVSLTSKKNITFLLPEFEDKILENKIKNDFSDKNTLIISSNKETINLDDFKYTLFIDDKGLNHDSAIFLEIDNFTFFNQNDCKIYDQLDCVLKISNKIDFYACQFSGANWHPSTFIIGEEEKISISDSRNKQKFIRLFESIEKLCPDNFIASAGPVCFLDPKEDYINLNTYNFPHADQLFKFLKPLITKYNLDTNLLTPKPGEIIEKNSNMILPPSKDEIKKYRDLYFNGRPKLKVTTKEIITFLNNKLSKIADLIKYCDFQGPIIFTLEKKNFIVDFLKITIKVIKIDNFPKDYLQLNASEWWYKLMVDNENGQSLCLTMHPRILRKNKYCVYQNLFLFSNLDDIKNNIQQTLNLNEKRCKIRLKNGDTYEINKYCPHPALVCISKT